MSRERIRNFRNERLMSVRRLRNLCRDETDRALVDAFLTSVARWRPRPRLARDQAASELDPSRGEPFFRDGSVPIRRTSDAGFLKHGWLKPENRCLAPFTASLAQFGDGPGLHQFPERGEAKVAGVADLQPA